MLTCSTLATLQAPTYRVVQRMQWTGLNHLVVFGKLKALVDQWRPQHIVIDATGVGEGLWAMLEKAAPMKVIPVKFSAEKKSEIGYRFISLIETGRFRDCCLHPVGAQRALLPDASQVLCPRTRRDCPHPGRPPICRLPGRGTDRPAQDDALGSAGGNVRRERRVDPR